MKVLTVVLLVTGSLTAQIGQPTSNRRVEDLQIRSGKMEGKVVNSANGLAVPNVTLTLRTVSGARPSKYVVTSDVAGVFLFDLVEPGRYELSAEKVGFLRGYYGKERAKDSHTPLELSEGQFIRRLLFKLTPQGVISGRVTDKSGEPMQGVSITVMRPGYSQGKRALLAVRGTVSTDLGEYRLANLDAGGYYVVARPVGSRSSIEQMQIAYADVPLALAAQNPEKDYVDTYYPSSLDSEGSSVIQVQAGSETSGVDITLEKTHVFQIRGQVVDASGQPVAEARIALTTSKTGGVVHMSTLGGSPVVGGRFELTGVIPGIYDLVAEVSRNGQVLYARQRVSVDDRNVTDAVIRIPESVDVNGRLRITGLEAQNPPSDLFRIEGIRIGLFPAEGFGLGQIPKAITHANGSFVLRKVVPDKFRIHVSGTPSGCYLKSILMSGRQCTDGVVDLTYGGSVEIVLAVGAAEVMGSVVDANDRPTSAATVSLVPSDGSRESRPDLIRTAIANERGQFSLKDVVPGAYDIFAWQGVDPEAINSPEFRRLFKSKSTTLAVNDGERETVQLKAISAEDVKTTGIFP